MDRGASKIRMLTAWGIVAITTLAAQGVEYPGPQPGTAEASADGDRIVMQNHVLSASWQATAHGLTGFSLIARQTGASLPAGEDVFRIVLGNGTVYRSSELTSLSGPHLRPLLPQPDSPVLARRTKGQAVEIPLTTEDGRLRITWRARLRDGSNYVRQELEIGATDADVSIREISWYDEASTGAESAGSVDGSLVVDEPFFLGCEDPMAENRVVNTEQKQGGQVRCRLSRNAALRQTELLTQSFVVGVYPAGQLRRAFLCYLEQQRAHPYRPFLHYNSWYDIAWTPFALNEQNCLEAIRLFGERFIKRHDVVMDALVFDDGWDDPKTLWHFHSGFPDGFAPLAELCRQYDTRLGVWLSPFGGYGQPREQRLENGRQQGFEINEAGFSLAGPRYYEAFKQACVGMIRKYGVNHFKFDGIAKGMHAAGGGEYIRDTEAMRRLMLELREVDPNLYINLTTGSWPSPFWLRFADSVWRQGGDMGFTGAGPRQQQWLTYRDQETYRNIVCRGPLYPLNSLMTQGVAYSRQGHAGDPTFNSAGFKDDVRAFFGSGTGLQELYIQPGKLTDQDWSVLAEAAKWSRANADVLVDTHWIGGDPGMGRVYGFASWSKRKGILMLRNPDDQPQDFTLDVATAFELPPGASTAFSLLSPWQEDTGKPALLAEAGKPLRISLQPFQVIVVDAVPAREEAHVEWP